MSSLPPLAISTVVKAWGSLPPVPTTPSCRRIKDHTYSLHPPVKTRKLDTVPSRTKIKENQFMGELCQEQNSLRMEVMQSEVYLITNSKPVTTQDLKGMIKLCFVISFPFTFYFQLSYLRVATNVTRGALSRPQSWDSVIRGTHNRRHLAASPHNRLIVDNRKQGKRKCEIPQRLVFTEIGGTLQSVETGVSIQAN